MKRKNPLIFVFGHFSNMIYVKLLKVISQNIEIHFEKG